MKWTAPACERWCFAAQIVDRPDKAAPSVAIIKLAAYPGRIIFEIFHHQVEQLYRFAGFHLGHRPLRIRGRCAERIIGWHTPQRAFCSRRLADQHKVARQLCSYRRRVRRGWPPPFDQWTGPRGGLLSSCLTALVIRRQVAALSSSPAVASSSARMALSPSALSPYRLSRVAPPAKSPASAVFSVSERVGVPRRRHP